MRCPRIKELPYPPPGRTGWPWTKEAPPLPDTRPDGGAWPRISIVTPSYNQGCFIEETIRAVLLQGYPELEYIISEGGSTDKSMEIIEKYLPWLKLLTEDRNRGMSRAINKGFKECSGDIITWIASDDIYLPGAFSKVGSHWPEVKGCGAVVGAFHFMDKNSTVDWRKHSPRLPGEGPIDLTILSPAKWRLHQVATFYTRQALDGIGRYVREDLHHNMDRELLYRICKNYKTFLINEPLAVFRIHSQSKSWNISNLIPMAKEYAGIQYMFFTENQTDNKRRIKIARYIKAKGYLKYAKYNRKLLSSIDALMIGLFYHPGFIVHKGYITTWMKVLGILPVLRWLKNYGRLSQKQTNHY